LFFGEVNMSSGEVVRILSVIAVSVLAGATLAHLRQQGQDLFSIGPLMTQPTPDQSPQPPKPAKSPRLEKPLPATGIFQPTATMAEKMAAEKMAAENIVPFSVVAPSGSPAEKTDSAISKALQRHYLVKLQDWESGKLLLTLFVRAGETAQTRVPLGKYRLKYASGRQWYGETILFGDETVVEQAIDPFIFVRSEDDQIIGATILFEPSATGTMRSKKLDPQDF
jgi:hypothetical protein